MILIPGRLTIHALSTGTIRSHPETMHGTNDDVDDDEEEAFDVDAVEFDDDVV